MAFPDGWNRKCKLTIQASKISATLTDFPVLVTEDTLPSEIFDADGSNPAQNGGGDIRFSSDSAGATQLACEVVGFVTDNDPANGTAEIYVSIPSISSSVDTDFYIWYNTSGSDTQPAVDAAYGREATWDDNYIGVYHLESTSCVDSTGTSDGTATGPSATTGQIGNGLTFDGTNDYVDLNRSDIDITSGSIETWFNPGLAYNSGTYEFLWAMYYGGQGELSCQGYTDDNYYVGWNRGSDDRVVTARTTGNWIQSTWQKLDFTWTNSGTSYLRHNASAVADNGGGTTTATIDGNMELARINLGGKGEFTGLLDEWRVSNSVRPDAWLNASYESQNDPSTFIVEGTPESAAGIEAAITGVQATSAIDTLSGIGNAIAAITGTQATSAIDTLTISTISGTTAALTGVQTTSAVDTLSSIGSAIAAITGTQSTSAIDLLTIVTTGSASATLTGVQATSALGTLTASTAVTSVKTKTDNFNDNTLHPAYDTYKTVASSVTITEQNNRLEIASPSDNGVQGGMTLLQSINVDPSVNGSITISFYLDAINGDNGDLYVSLTKTSSNTCGDQADWYRIYSTAAGWGADRKVNSSYQLLNSSASGGGAGKTYAIRFNTSSPEVEMLIDGNQVATDSTYDLTGGSYDVFPHLEANLDSGEDIYFDNFYIEYNVTDDYPYPIAWEDHGYIVPLSSTPGDSDYGMYSTISPCCCVKLNNTLYLYYIGTTSRTAHTHRSLHLATSTDEGATWNKYGSNPILEYWVVSPRDDEEGIFSAAATLNGSTIELYVARVWNTGTPGDVHSEIALYTTTNGYTLNFDSVVLDYNESGLFNSGDEIFPLGIYRDTSTSPISYRMYYTSSAWELCKVDGTANNNFNAATSGGVPNDGSPRTIRGGGNIHAIDSNTVVAFTLDDNEQDPANYHWIEAPPSDIQDITVGRLVQFRGDMMNHQAAFKDGNNWYLFYKDAQGVPNGIGMLKISFDATPSITGNSATSGIGTLSATANALFTIDGVNINSAVGTFTILTQSSETATLTGVSSSAQVGNITALGSALLSINGVNTTGQIGTLLSQAAALVALTGNGTIGNLGTLSARGGSTIDITGNAATGYSGTITVAVAGGQTVALTGVSASGQIGTLTITTIGSETVQLNGVQASGSIDSLTITGGAVADITGVFTNSAINDFTITGGAVVDINGNSISSAVGTLTASEATLIQLSGVSVSSVVGVLDITSSAAFSITGVQADSSIGSITANTGITDLIIPGYRVFTIQSENRTLLILSDDTTKKVH